MRELMLLYLAFMAAAWHGGVDGADEFVNSPELLDATLRAMDFWFSNDFTDESCLNGGCDCSASGLWSTNWFSNVGHRHLPSYGQESH